MADIRTTMFFSMHQYGWSESYVKQGQLDTAMMGDALALATARRLILSFNVDLTHARLSDLAVQRDSRLIEVASGSVKGNNVQVSDVATTCILARVESSTRYRKSIYLRGHPDADIRTITGGKVEIDSTYQNDVEKYLKFLKSHGWGFMVRDKEPTDPANPALLRYGKISLVDNITTSPNIVVETVLPHNMPNNSSVLITGVKGPKSVNDLHPIEVTTGMGASKFRLRDFGGITGKTDARLYIGGGSFRAYQPKFAPIDNYDVIKVGHRDTGRPFFSPVGRRRRQPT